MTLLTVHVRVLLIKQEGDGITLTLEAGTKEIICEFPKHLL